MAIPDGGVTRAARAAGAGAGRAALLVAAVAAGVACSLPDHFIGAADGGAPGDGGIAPDAGACDPAVYPRCDGDYLVTCVGGVAVPAPCGAFGCNTLFDDHCNACAPGVPVSCQPDGTLQTCDTLGIPGVTPCLSGTCFDVPAPGCTTCTDTAPVCFMGQLLECTGGVQTTVSDCDGQGCGASGVEVCNACAPSAPLCSPAGYLQQCGADGQPAALLDVCEPYGCSDSDGAGGGAHCNACTPGAAYCGADGNVHACTADGEEGALVETCDGGRCGGGLCRAPLAPSNIPAAVVTAAEGTGALGTWAAAAASGCTAGWDTLVADSDTGEVRCYAGSSPRGTLRPGGAPATLAAGIWFDVVAAPAAGVPDLGVYVMTDLDVPAGAALRLRGANAVALVATGCTTVEGDVLAGGGSYDGAPGAPVGFAVDDGALGGGTGVPGPGGFARGGADGTPAAAGPGAGGTGGGGAPHGGGGGGGYGAAGGAGGASTSGGAGGTGGAVYYCGGDGGTTTCAAAAADFNAALVPLAGGSGGGGGGEDADSGQGGAGGGAIELVSLASCGVTIASSGRVDSGGEGGRRAASDQHSGGGGGAGGAILLEGYRVAVYGKLTAGGGGGGGGDDGGGSGAAPGARGTFDGSPAPGGVGTGGGAAGGAGGAGASPAGVAGGADEDSPGGGGASTGRLRLNGFEVLIFTSALLSPATATSAATTGTPSAP
ncbi:MAG TPA: hypothetical protein VG389_27320 [Myxococcota bacterium]|nr:hypothetical protein [Myxococcota bacterium]